MDVRLRPAGTGDARFLGEMLREAAAWRAEDARSLEDVLAEPHDAVYVEGWGRDGDVAVVAEDESGLPVGAAWYRTFTDAHHGYGYVATDVPEMAIAVRPEARRHGIGAALLAALVEGAGARGVRALSLSVEAENPAIRLYERAGFRRVALVDEAWTMRIDLQ